MEDVLPIKNGDISIAMLEGKSFLVLFLGGPLTDDFGARCWAKVAYPWKEAKI